MTETHLVLLCSPRTGSNLLSGMLSSHGDVLMGAELFNPSLVSRHEIPWPNLEEAEQSQLHRLREHDLGTFFNHLYSRTESVAHSVVGFKLFYEHAIVRPDALAQIQQDDMIRVVHLKRRNRLARFVSAERAARTNVWTTHVGEKPQKFEPIALDPERLVEDFVETERREVEFANLISMHPTLDVFYEDLALSPLTTALTVTDFLGLAPNPDLHIKYIKTGGTSLRNAISNFDELAETLQERFPFFTD